MQERRNELTESHNRTRAGSLRGGARRLCRGAVEGRPTGAMEPDDVLRAHGCRRCRHQACRQDVRPSVAGADTHCRVEFLRQHRRHFYRHQRRAAGRRQSRRRRLRSRAAELDFRTGRYLRPSIDDGHHQGPQRFRPDLRQVGRTRRGISFHSTVRSDNRA